MGIFSKKPRIAISDVCDMCGKAEIEGCGSADNHVEQISGGSPTWLPVQIRTHATGEYTWMCVRCGAFPDMKWPSHNGAWSGMALHLGKTHHVGQMVDISASMPVPYRMRPIE